MLAQTDHAVRKPASADQDHQIHAIQDIPASRHHVPGNRYNSYFKQFCQKAGRNDIEYLFNTGIFPQTAVDTKSNKDNQCNTYKIHLIMPQNFQKFSRNCRKLKFKPRQQRCKRCTYDARDIQNDQADSSYQELIIKFFPCIILHNFSFISLHYISLIFVGLNTYYTTVFGNMLYRLLQLFSSCSLLIYDDSFSFCRFYRIFTLF